MSKKIHWQYIKDGYPIEEWIWVTDHKEVWLRKVSQPLSNFNSDWMWALADIDHPQVPKKTFHYCKKDNVSLLQINREALCQEQEDGQLIFFIQSQSGFMEWKVRFCPFCGFKAKISHG